MKRFTGLMKRNKSGSGSEHFSNQAPVDSPEANAGQAIRLFCESEGTNPDEEVLHLPVIVEAAESSPQAAQAAAQQIRKFLHNDYASKPSVQYNAIMLVRILSDNPGPSFTKHFDNKMVKNVKDLLRNGRDPSTQQLLRETLDSIEFNKRHDEGVQGLITMWRREKGANATISSSARSRRTQAGLMSPDHLMSGGGPGQGFNQVAINRNQLPPAHELASRVEEARNTAKILLQMIQQSEPGELLGNEMVKEFNDRCHQAQKSMQIYINCDSPPPDDDTMLTLIETNEQLSLASSRYHRATLTARRQMSQTASGGSTPAPQNSGSGALVSPPAQEPAESLFKPAPPASAPGSQSNAAMQPPRRQYTNGSMDAFAAPPGPPPPQNRMTSPTSPTQYQTPSGPPLRTASPDSYAVPSGPPPPRQQPEPLITTSPQQQQYQTSASNPFADPSETQHNDEGSGYSPVSPPRRKPFDAFETSDEQQKGQLQQPLNAASAIQQQRPALGPYHNSGVTPSFLGRQESAAGGLTMHAAVPDEEEEERPQRRLSRVDVRGTGGFRGA